MSFIISNTGGGGSIDEGNVWRPALLEGDTAAQTDTKINDAITAAAPVRGVVKLPAGLFVTNTINWDPRVKLQGQGIGATTLRKTTAGSLIYKRSATWYGRNEICDMTLEGGVDNASRAATTAIDIDNIAHFNFSNVYMRYFTGYVVNFIGVLIGSFDNCYFYDSLGGIKAIRSASSSIGALSPNLVTFRSCKFAQVSKWAVNWSEGSSLHFVAGTDIEDNGTVGDADSGGIKIAASGSGLDKFGLSINGAWFEDNKGTMIKITSSQAGVRHDIRNTIVVASTPSNIINVLDVSKGSVSLDNFESSGAINMVDSQLYTTETVTHGTVTLDATSTHKKYTATTV